MIRILGTIFAALLGLAFGSFLNVCLSRWPEGESVVKPRSHCRTLWANAGMVGECAAAKLARAARPLPHLRSRGSAGAIRWWSWQSGCCGQFAAWRFMGQALDPSLPFLLVYYDLANALCTLLLLWLLVALAVLDAEHLWLPNILTLPGIALGIRLFRFEVRFSGESGRSHRSTSDSGSAKHTFRHPGCRSLALDRILDCRRPHPPHPLDLLARSPSGRHRPGRCQADGHAGGLARAPRRVAGLCHWRGARHHRRNRPAALSRSPPHRRCLGA